MKNSKKNAATTKKDYQAALMKKAAKKANATSVVDSVNTDNISITADTAPMRKVNGKALQYALAYLLSNYPAIEATRKSDYKIVSNMLLKLNVDLTSKKDISAETERILNIFGFTNNKHHVTKEFISKYDIPQLVTFMFNGYQEKHPDFCKIEQSVLLKCKDELDAISKNIGILLSCTLYAQMPVELIPIMLRNCLVATRQRLKVYLITSNVPHTHAIFLLIWLPNWAICFSN